MIEITQTAREKIQSFVAADVVRDPALRIQLDPDARSPLSRSYAISLVDREDREKTEIAINIEGIRVFLNLDTSNLLSGATIDWAEENGSSGFRVLDAAAKAAPVAAPAAGARSTPSDPLAEQVQQLFDEMINPRIAAHGGAVELVDVEDDVVYLRMSGGCQGCAASAATLRMGVERMLRESIPHIQGVVDVTDHSAGENPYY